MSPARVPLGTGGHPPTPIGMVGLGRMGSNLTRRLLRGGHHCVVHDTDPTAVARLRRAGATAARSYADLVAHLERPRAIWVMVPAEVTDATIEAIAEHLDPDDVVIDGGNSFWKDDLARAASLGARGIHYLDVGTSGGVAGLERGFCLMIGGDAGPVRRLDDVFATLAPGVDAAPRTARPGRRRAPTTAETGYLHCGPTGAGHFVKMVHNGIEYGLMAAYAEGLNLLAHAGPPAGDVEGAPALRLADRSLPDAYVYDFDLAAISELWRRGSVVSSWLLDLTAEALAADPALSAFEGRVADSGEGRWTVETAVERGVPTPVLSAALFGRFASRGGAELGNRVLSAMRSRFGGHGEHRA